MNKESVLPSVGDIAQEFSKQLRATLTADQLAEVVKRNAAEGNHISVCHTHDFCDANQVMLDVLKELGIEDHHAIPDDLFNEAWQTAKVNGFNVA